MSGTLLKTIKGGPGTSHHTSTIYCVAMAPSGKMFATSSADKSVRLWDTESGAFIKVMYSYYPLYDGTV